MPVGQVARADGPDTKNHEQDGKLVRGSGRPTVFDANLRLLENFLEIAKFILTAYWN